MLAAFKDAPLFKSPDNNLGGYYASLEAWKYNGDTEAKDDKLKVCRLEETDIADWIWQQGAYSAAHSTSTPNRKLEGGFRILFAQPTTTFREAIPDGLTANPVLDALSLPQCSFASFQMSSGVFSLHTMPEGSTIDTCTKLGFVFRTPQKAECSTGGISLCHDISTGITTALILGYSFTLEQFVSTPPKALEAFKCQLKKNWTLWSHPLLLPSSFLVLHTIRVRSHIYDTLSPDVMSMERCIGVTKAGRPDNPQFVAPQDRNEKYDEALFFENEAEEPHMDRNVAKKLTASINNLSTSILFTKRSPKWDMDCSKFLLGLMTESKRLKDYAGIPGQQFEQTLQYVHSYSEALAEATETFQARLRLQLNILYTAIAQDDGQTSARLATSANLEANSMKILAVIAAIYLPGTFVASLFSTGMFDWSSGWHGSVSKSFWIYWIVAVPLTLITLACWFTWEKNDKNRFLRDQRQSKTQQGAESRRDAGTLSTQRGYSEV